MTKVHEIRLAAGAGAAVLLCSAMGAPWVACCIAVAAVLWAGRRRQSAPDASEDRVQALYQREEQLANTAHELRTPLTAVTTAIELLREGYATTQEDTDTFLGQAAVAARHMAFLINDVVDLSALENGRLSLHNKAQRVQDLLFDTTQVMQLTAQARGIELDIEDPPDDLIVHGDRGRFLQITFNLIANAIKYSQHGDCIRIRHIAEDRMVRFEIHDNGPGVPENMRDALFTRFGRAHSEAMPSIPGTGLGLFVCKLLIEHMGGTIGYRTADPQGSIFWFALPRMFAAKEEDDSSEVGTPAIASA